MTRLVTLAFVLALSIGAACSDGDGDRADATATPTTAPATSPASTVATDDCEPQGEFTPAQTEGPYFKAGSPEKSDLYAEVGKGTKLVLTGSVLSTGCTPVARAKLDFWQADDEGAYDNTGFRLRGHQFTDANGRYRLTTVIPGEYPGRTPHIHVKVQPPTGSVLTTQLYVSGVAQNESDAIFNERLLMDVSDADDGKKATFTFVVVTG